ncbi:hypothetical protein F4677DRAFT_444331 [Hypoxylon crocopeplum]|nr:hypothetical protein F4677DRAFT_444331 [Hypoxylon crocopeplum]
MRFLTPVLAIAICTAASTVETREPSTPVRTADEPLPAKDSHVTGDLHEPIQAGTVIAARLCFYTAEDIRAGAAGYTSSYSIDELIAVKEELERNHDCPHRGSIGEPMANVRAGPTPAPRAMDRPHMEAPRCVHAIVPGPGGAEGGTGDTSGTPGGPLASAAAAALGLAVAALVA